MPFVKITFADISAAKVIKAQKAAFPKVEKYLGIVLQDSSEVTEAHIEDVYVQIIKDWWSDVETEDYMKDQVPTSF